MLRAAALLACVVGARAECSMCEVPNTVANFTGLTPSALVAPTGNGSPTGTAFSVQGETVHEDFREFLVHLGLDSRHGATGRPTPYHDKVTLYTGISAHPGTGDVWSINPLLTQEANSGEYNAQGIELDFNNQNAHRGDADGGAGLAPPVSYGFSVTGASQYRSTAAMAVMGNEKQWNRGIVFANDAVAQSTFQDLGNPEKSVDIRGNPRYGVYQSSTDSTNYFAGKTKVGSGSAGGEVALEVNGDVHVSGSLFGAGAAGERRPVLLGSSAAGAHRLLSGNALLDASGGAEIVIDAAELLESTGSLEQHDVTYHLTPLGAAMPSLHVSQELQVSGRRASFAIGGGAAGKRASWQLSAAFQPQPRGQKAFFA